MLISIAVYDTVENERTWMTEATIQSLAKTVDWSKHRLIISDNGSCASTHELYRLNSSLMPFKVIYNGSNLGTARAVNLGWLQRLPGEHCVKMDNDVVIHQPDWADWMEDVFDREPEIGICGLKRKDLMESPITDGGFRSTVSMLPHEKGQRWLIVEDVNGVMGTCQGFSSLLLDKIGYLRQPGVYGFDDSLASHRARLAGFRRVFLHGFEIDHIDPGGSEHGKWKIEQADKVWLQYKTLVGLYEMGVEPLYYDGEFDESI